MERKTDGEKNRWRDKQMERKTDGEKNRWRDKRFVTRGHRHSQRDSWQQTDRETNRDTRMEMQERYSHTKVTTK